MTLLTVCLCSIRLATPIVRVDGRTAPITALSHAPPSLLGQRVFNEYGFGGYLIFSRVRPFIDGRADMYGDAFIREYNAATGLDRNALEQTLARYRVQWTILVPGTAPAAMLDLLPGWCRLYADRVAVIHVRSPSGNCPAPTPSISPQDRR